MSRPVFALLLALSVPLWGASPAAAQQVARSAAAISLPDTLSLPTVFSLTGSDAADRFAWIENRAGVRNLWISDPKGSRRITRRDADDGIFLSEPALNRAGTMLAYVEGGDPEFPDLPLPNTGLATATPRQNVHLVTLDGDMPADRLLSPGHSPVFSPDGGMLAFSAGGRLFIAATDGERAPANIVSTQGQIRELRWSPDGSKIAFALRRDNHVFIALYDVAQRSMRFLDPQFGDDIEPSFSSDGKHIAFIRAYAAPAGAPLDKPLDKGRFWSIVVADVASGDAHTIWTAPEGAGNRYYGTRSRNLFWSQDGQLIFPWERDGWIHAYALPADGKGEPRLLTPGTGEVETFLLAPGGRDLVFAGNMGDIDRRHIWRMPLAGGAPRALTTGSGIESFPAFAKDALAVIASDARRPARPMLLAGRNMTPMPGQSHAAPAETRSYVVPEQIVFQATDGVDVHGQLFRSASAGGSARRPALVFIHGGPRRQMLLGFHPSAYYSNGYAMNQYLAAQGYIVLTVNYRSGTGYGSAFREAPETARDGASEYRDILAAGRYLAGRDDVDPARIGLWGGSWGGYLTALGLARNSDLFAAGADLHGVHDMLRPAAPGLSPDQALAAQQRAWASSPVASIDAWRSPVLLIHGDDDRNVDFAQSVLLARMLKGRGIPHQLLAIPNERHGFVRYGSWLSAYRAIDHFFARTLLKENVE